jgi:hypothetical protein
MDLLAPAAAFTQSPDYLVAWQRVVGDNAEQLEATPGSKLLDGKRQLRGVAWLGSFLARKSDGEPGWQTIWKGWFILMILVEGYELAQAITSPK